MNQFQKIKFNSIEEFMEYLPENELMIVKKLRSIILEILPNPTEKLLYNVPFYLQKTRICFIWPSTVPWGNVKHNGVQLGFPGGYLMRDEINYLERGDRKQVYTKTFMGIENIDEELIRTYVIEALRIDNLSK